MATLITVEQSRTASREFLISIKNGDKTIAARQSAGSDAAGAAAQAVSAAMRYAGTFCIIAHSEVRAHIPSQFLSGSTN